jgi:4-amino-4-deoxy-L-arabinose transferase-like glycosyltransferase
MNWVRNLNENPRPLYIAIVLLLFPAIYINLSLTPLIADEGIRGLVALEMMQTGDYLTPKLGSVFYHNKPPLYNWLIAGSYYLTGQANEFSIRLTMTIFLICFMAAIYFLTRREVGNKVAAITAISFFTCARVLTYDSLYGLIDICFSGFTFVMFVLIYRLGKEEKYTQLFFAAYLLTAFTFLMKGLPAIAFVGISLIAYLLYQRQWKRLFSWQHIVAGLTCVGIIGMYYLFYFQRNPDRTIVDVFMTLLSESSKRTAVEQSSSSTIGHLLLFPFEYIYAFAPWTILFIYLVRKEARQFIKSHPFLMICTVLFLANIVLYWLSPRTHPRYLFMFVPLSGLILIYIHEQLKAQGSKWVAIIEKFFLVLLVLISLGSAAVPFLKDTKNLENIYLTAAALFIGLSIATILYWKVTAQRLVVLALFLIIVRIGFNLIVLPVRYEKSKVVPRMQAARELGQLSKDKKLYVFSEPIRRYFHGEQVLPAHTLFYITAEAGRPLQHSDNPKRGDWFIIEEGKPLNVPADTVFILPSYQWLYPVMEVK